MRLVQPFRMLAGLRSIARALAIALPFCLNLSHGAEPKPKVQVNPDEFKALILTKLPSYVTKWPEEAFGETNNKIILGILGKERPEFIENLKGVAKFVKIEGRELVIQEYENATRIGKCHILFVPAASNAQWLEFTKRQVVHGILTVGETENFTKAESGGTLRIVPDDKKLEVNPDNAKKAGFRISAQLLKMVLIVK